MARNMVLTCLHFRILEFPLSCGWLRNPAPDRVTIGIPMKHCKFHGIIVGQNCPSTNWCRISSSCTVAVEPKAEDSTANKTWADGMGAACWLSENMFLKNRMLFSAGSAKLPLGIF